VHKDAPQKSQKVVNLEPKRNIRTKIGAIIAKSRVSTYLVVTYNHARKTAQTAKFRQGVHWRLKLAFTLLALNTNNAGIVNNESGTPESNKMDGRSRQC
jgi:hypothetical protein